MAVTRIYDFDAILNFRDFGNYETRDGRRVKPAHLFRSANFHRATERDLTRLADLDIGLRVDLRYRKERERQPNKWPGSQRAEFLDFPEDNTVAGDLAPHEMFIRENLFTPQDARRYMRESYTARPDDPLFQSMFSQTLRHMARSGDPIVIHCAAGKDRTGTLAAIILGVLGVDPDIVMEDYLLTLQAVDIDAFLSPAAKMMGERHGRNYEPEALRPMFGVEESYLEGSLNTIGNLDRYVSDQLGITAAEQSEIREKYLSG